jgi:hypothetical protein
MPKPFHCNTFSFAGQKRIRLVFAAMTLSRRTFALLSTVALSVAAIAVSARPAAAGSDPWTVNSPAPGSTPAPGAKEATNAAPKAGPSTGSAPEGVNEFGLLVHYMTIDPVLAVAYTKYQSVAGATFGGYYERRSEGGTRVIIDLAYTQISPKDGSWLAAGKDPPSTQWTQFRGTSLLSADVMYGHEFTNGGAFGFFLGGGVGIAVTQGTVIAYDATGTNFDRPILPLQNPDKKKIPVVTPTVLFKLGPTIQVGKKITLSIDAGLQDGFFAGTSVGFRM